MNLKPISLVAAASHLPENVIDNDFFASDEKSNIMFKGAHLRRHMAPEDTATEMIGRATEKLFDRTNTKATDIDILLTNVTLPDLPFTGCGAEVVHRLGLNPRWVLDVQNAGCVSFIHMMEVARALMNSSDAKTALICNVQTAAGRIFANEDNRTQPQAPIPGDGCGVALLVANDESPITSIITRCHGEFASDMQVVADDGRYWWQPGARSFRIDFSQRKMVSVVRRANRIVPEVIFAACKQAGIRPDEVNTLITNQPNPYFLRNWREALQLSEEHHIHTFEDHGNLFGAALPISFDRGINTGRIRDNTNLVFGGFSHAGDYSAAAVVSWRKPKSAQLGDAA